MLASYPAPEGSPQDSENLGLNVALYITRRNVKGTLVLCC